MGERVFAVQDRAMRDRCFYCGIRTNRRTRSEDHVTPLCRNGSNEKTNKVNACKDCNHFKAHLTLDEYRSLMGGSLFWAERVGHKSIWHLRPDKPTEGFVTARTRKPSIIRGRWISRMGVKVPVVRQTPPSEIGS